MRTAHRSSAGTEKKKMQRRNKYYGNEFIVARMGDMKNHHDRLQSSGRVSDP